MCLCASPYAGNILKVIHQQMNVRIARKNLIKSLPYCASRILTDESIHFAIEMALGWNKWLWVKQLSNHEELDFSGKI